MGRQTIWGGAGKPPSREVMMAAAKAARQEMMQRIRDNKGAEGGARGGERSAKPKQPQGQRNANGNGNGNGNGSPATATGPGRAAPARRSKAGPAHGHSPRHGDDAQPRDGAHNIASPFVQRDAPVRHTDGQPDPLRTSVDSMGGRGRRGGGGGGGRSNRGGGGGFGPRGPGNPTRTFGR